MNVVLLLIALVKKLFPLPHSSKFGFWEKLFFRPIFSK